MRQLFWSLVDKSDYTSCWEWLGFKNNYGYGMLRLRGRKLHQAHRISYQINVGPIPRGYLVLHNCDNPSCVNPGHLRVGTPKDNARDRVKRGRQNYQRGCNGPTSKLCAAQVIMIRTLHDLYGLSTADIAEMVPVGRHSVGRIVRRQTYQDVE